MSTTLDQIKSASFDSKTMAESIALPKGWSVIQGIIAKVLQSGSQEEVYIKIEAPEKDIKGLTEKRQLKMIVLKRKEAMFQFQKDILSFFLIYHLPKNQSSLSAEDLEHSYTADASLVQLITNITRSNEIPQLASTDISISNDGPKERGGQWSCYHAGLLPDFQASRFFEEMVKHNIFTQEESQFLATICRRKRSPEMVQLDQIFRTALDKIDISAALKYAKELHALSITINKQAGITLNIPTGKKNNSYVKYYDEAHAGYTLGLQLKKLGKLDEALKAFAIVGEDSPLYDKISEEIYTILTKKHNGDKAKMTVDLKKIFPNEEINLDQEEDEDSDAKEADEENREDEDLDLESLSTVNSSNVLLFCGPGSSINLSGGIFISGPSKQTGPVFDFAQGRRYLPVDYRDLLELDDSLPGNIQAFKMMIKGGLLKKEQSHDNFLGQAAAAGKINIVKVLIQEKADVNFPSNFGVTPVMQALEKGQLAMVEFLIEQGAKLLNSEYKPLLSYSAKGKCTAEFLALLDRKKIAYDHLFEYPGRDKLSFEKLLKDEELSEELKIKFLHKMIKGGLLTDVDANRWGSVLIQAISANKLSFIDVLIEAGADVNQLFSSGETALRKAISMGNSLIVKKLIQAKANVNHQDSWGESLLITAVKKGNLELVQLLIQAKVDVNHRLTFGDTALTLALKNGQWEIAKLLIENGAQLENKEENHFKVCCLASAEQGKCVKELITQLDKKFASDMNTDVAATSQLELKKRVEFDHRYTPTIPASDLEKIQIIGEILTELHPEETDEKLIERSLFIVKCIYGAKAYHFMKSLLELTPLMDDTRSPEQALDPMLSMLQTVYHKPKSWFLNESKFFNIYKEYGSHNSASSKP